jgi:hypothetical protein
MKRCHFCGLKKPDVSKREDPFARTVNDEEWRVPMCDDCEQDRAEEA